MMALTVKFKTLLNMAELNREFSYNIFDTFFDWTVMYNVEKYIKVLKQLDYIIVYQRGDQYYFKVLKRIPEKLTLSRLVKDKKLHLRQLKIDKLTNNAKNNTD